MGRFTSADRGSILIHLPKSLNRYIYTANDPVNRTDASGNQWALSNTILGELSPPRPGSGDGIRASFIFEPEPEPEPQFQGPFIPNFRQYIGRYGRFGDAQEFRLVNVLERIWNISTAGSPCATFFQNALGGRAGEAALQVKLQQAQWSNAHTAVRPGALAPLRHRISNADWTAIQQLGNSPALRPSEEL
jgi:hypothetical protein